MHTNVTAPPPPPPPPAPPPAPPPPPLASDAALFSCADGARARGQVLGFLAGHAEAVRESLDLVERRAKFCAAKLESTTGLRV